MSDSHEAAKQTEGEACFELSVLSSHLRFPVCPLVHGAPALAPHLWSVVELPRPSCCVDALSCG